MGNNSNSNENIESNVEHYEESPKMLHGVRYCNAVKDEDLAGMPADRRWREDNRVPTWKYGMVNCGFDQNFMYGGNIVNDTDHRFLKISGEVENEDGDVGRGIIGTRNIRYNGRWFKMK